MCPDHKDKIILYLFFGIILLVGSLSLQFYVVYLIVDFNNTLESIQDVKFISLGISLIGDLIIVGLIVGLYVKASEFLRTIDSVVGPSRAASHYLLSSDE